MDSALILIVLWYNLLLFDLIWFFCTWWFLRKTVHVVEACICRLVDLSRVAKPRSSSIATLGNSWNYKLHSILLPRQYIKILPLLHGIVRSKILFRCGGQTLKLCSVGLDRQYNFLLLVWARVCQLLAEQFIIKFCFLGEGTFKLLIGVQCKS